MFDKKMFANTNYSLVPFRIKRRFLCLESGLASLLWMLVHDAQSKSEQVDPKHAERTNNDRPLLLYYCARQHNYML